MAWVRKTMIVSDAVAAQCRQLAEAVAGAAGANMWTAQLVRESDGAIFWISAGSIEEEFAAMIADANVLAAATGMPLYQCEALLSQCIVSDADPHAVIAESGLTALE